MAPSLIRTQWPRAPRGASWKPQPCASFGQVAGSQRSPLWILRSPRLVLATSWPDQARSWGAPTRAEWPRLRRQAVVPGCLEPRVLLVGVQELVGGLGPRVLRPRLPVPRVPGRLVAVLVPGVGDGLGDLLVVHGRDLGEVTVQDHPPRQPEARRVPGRVDRIVSVGEVVAEAGAEASPFLIERSDGEEVGDIDLVHELLGGRQQLALEGGLVGVARGGAVGGPR